MHANSLPLVAMMEGNEYTNIKFDNFCIVIVAQLMGCKPFFGEILFSFKSVFMTTVHLVLCARILGGLFSNIAVTSYTNLNLQILVYRHRL